MFPVVAIIAGAASAASASLSTGAALGPAGPAAAAALKMGADVWTTDQIARLLDVPSPSEALQGLLNSGPLRKFFKSEVGRSLARAFATSTYGGLVPVFGTNIASTVFAIPGVLRGDPTDVAYFDELLWRIQETADITGQEWVKDPSAWVIDQARSVTGAARIAQAQYDMTATVATALLAIEAVKRSGLGSLAAQMSEGERMVFDYNDAAQQLSGSMTLGYAQFKGIDILEAMAYVTGKTDALGTLCSRAHSGTVFLCTKGDHGTLDS